MKIANILINPQIDNLGLNYIEKAFIEYALYLTKRNAQVLSIFESNKLHRNATIEASTKVFELSSKKILKFYAVFKSWLEFIEFAPDVVLCHSLHALFFAKIARLFIDKKFAIILISYNEPNKFFKSDFVIVKNSSLVKNFINLGIKRENIFVINNSIDIEQNFQPIQKNSFSNHIKIGSIGSINLDKNFDKVLRAIVILKSRGINCSYEITGRGDAEDNLNILALELGLENNFKIHDFNDNKKQFFSNIDICIMPLGNNSNADFILDAMLYSVPLIVSDCPAYQEIIEHQINGLKINIDDEQKIPNYIAEAVERYVKNEIEARQFAKRAYDKVLDCYSSEVVSNRVYNICKNASEIII